MRKHTRLRRLAGLAVAAVAAITATTLTSASSAQAVDTWIRINAYHSNLVANVPSPWTTNGLQVEQQPYGANAYNGQWKLNPKGLGDQTFEIENRYSHQCLDVTSTAVGAAVVQAPCDDSVSQMWTRWQDATRPVWRILNNWSGHYLSVENASLIAGADFVQTTYSLNATSQMMQIW